MGEIMIIDDGREVARRDEENERHKGDEVVTKKGWQDEREKIMGLQMMRKDEPMVA